MVEAEGTGAQPGERVVRAPAQEMSVRIEPHPERVVVHAEDQVLADSEGVLILYEGTQPPVVYFPRKDVDMARLRPSEVSTFSPTKGDCSYYQLDGGDDDGSVAWSYEAAEGPVAPIRGYLAFVPDRVDIIGLRAS